MFRNCRLSALVFSTCLLLLTPASFGQARPPVILIDAGGGAVGFGSLESLLKAQGIRTTHFTATSVRPKYGTQFATLEEVGEALGAVINQVADPQVDLIAYSMGGPVVRCYLSGKQFTPGVFKPPAEHKVRKVVFLGTGFFGAPESDPSGDISVRALEYGSRLQWDLATWNQHGDDMRQVDAVALVAAEFGVSDGVIVTTSGSLLFAYPDERTRVITGCHVPSLCSPGVAYVNDDKHPAWLVVNSFLSGTDDWKMVGHSPREDPVLSHLGGVMVAVKDAGDTQIQEVQLRMSENVMNKGGAPDCVGTFVADSVEKGDYTLHATAPFPVPDRTFTALPGTFTVITMKPGPLITAVVPAESEVKSSSIPASAIILITGERLGKSEVAAQAPFPTSLGSTSISVNDQPIPLMYVSESKIKAQLPADVTGFARLLVNTDEGTHSFNFFIGPPAPNKSSVSFTLSNGGANSTSTIGPSGDLKVGYATVNVDSGVAPYGTAVFSFRQNGVTISEAGVPASPPTTAARIFIDYRSSVAAIPGRISAGAIDINTGIAVVNNSSTSANITYTLRNMAADPLSMGHGTLAAGAHFARFIDQLKDVAPDFALPENFQVATQFASLEISSDQPLSILALRMTTNQRNEVLFTTTPTADLTMPVTEGATFFPQFADGGGYTTSLVLLNTSNGIETGTLQIMDDGGNPLVIHEVGGATDSVFRYSIPAGGAVRFQTDGLPAITKVGWSRVTPDTGTSAPVGAGVFGYNPESFLVAESGIPATDSTTHARVYVDMSGGHNTGLAIANLTSTNAGITIAAYQSDGITGVGTAQGLLMIPANGHSAGFADQIVTGLPIGFTGVLDIASSTPFAALTMRSLYNERHDFVPAIFPIADMNRSAPSPIVFPQIADGGGYVTQFILISAGGASNVTLNFCGEDGRPLPVGK